MRAHWVRDVPPNCSLGGGVAPDLFPSPMLSKTGLVQEIKRAVLDCAFGDRGWEELASPVFGSFYCNKQGSLILSGVIFLPDKIHYQFLCRKVTEKMNSLYNSKQLWWFREEKVFLTNSVKSLYNVFVILNIRYIEIIRCIGYSLYRNYSLNWNNSLYRKNCLL